jgi:hypothetical protein
MKFSDYRQSCEEARRKTFTFKKQKKTKPTETDVTIQVGIMAGTELKPKKGSNLPIKVSASIDADALLAVALEKHCRFNKDLIKRDREYKLLYPDKSIVAT